MLCFQTDLLSFIKLPVCWHLLLTGPVTFTVLHREDRFCFRMSSATSTAMQGIRAAPLPNHQGFLPPGQKDTPHIPKFVLVCVLPGWGRASNGYCKGLRVGDSRSPEPLGTLKARSLLCLEWSLSPSSFSFSHLQGLYLFYPFHWLLWQTKAFLSSNLLQNRS